MTAASPTIVATCGGLNGGGWSDSVYGPLLLHAIELAEVTGRAPRVTHINTAGGDQRHIEGAELEAARIAGVEASHVRFFPHPNIPDLREHLLRQDVIWVSGGSLVNLLAVWRAHGLDTLLTEAWQAGVVLAGGSAGALCWHEGGTTASFGPGISAVADGLGLLAGSLGVHWDSDPQRRPAHLAAIADGTLAGGYALEEGVGLVYRGSDLVDVVAERDGAAAWLLERSADSVTETRVTPRVLRDTPADPTDPTDRSTLTPPNEEARQPR
ncbi:Type 1 glutamine amidotransferase-like domain-containing protein [Leifsonia sp. NPDC058194]|uniref:Type 1 glutamine amidotransferase-like domain-containing protein n=1 Tax=Leifsonia sp. NPDC058194 TaxID=3346374 RepID=UPI0036D83236